MLRSFKAQLIAICIATLLLLPVVAFLPPNITRIILTFPLIFLFPGYTLLIALYPRKADMSVMERLLLGSALSLAIECLLLLAINYIWSLALYPSLICITLFIIGFSGVAWWRLNRTGDKNRPTFTKPSNPIAFSSLSKMLNNPLGYRKWLWILLIALSISITLYPVGITLEPVPIQSLNAIGNLPLFIALFLIWMIALIVLIFSKQTESKIDWEKLALVCIFVLVFIGFWTVKSFYDQGGDSLNQLSLVRYLQENNHLPEIKFDYFAYPGLFLLSNFISHISGADNFTTAYTLRIFAPILFAALFYLFLTLTLKNAYLSSIAALLAIISATGFGANFRPNLIAYVFLLAFLVILVRDGKNPLRSTGSVIIFIILTAAVTISYFAHSVMFFFILLFVYIMNWRSKEKPFRISIILLPLVMILIWQIYWATSTFTNASNYLPNLIKQLTGGGIFTTASVNAGSLTGAAVPLWTELVRYLKWGGFYALGTILAFIGMFRVKKLNSLEKVEVGGVLGSIILTVLLTILSPAGHEYYRYFQYAFIFIAPIIVRFCFTSNNQWRKIAFVLLHIFIFALSLPVFFTNASSIATHSVSTQEITAGEFLQKEYGNGDGLHVYGSGSYGSDIAWYYLPNAQHIGAKEYKDLTADTVHQDIARVVNEFQSSNEESIFIYSERIALIWYSNFFVKPDDPEWQSLKKDLAGINGKNIIFSNDYINIYRQPNSSSVGITE